MKVVGNYRARGRSTGMKSNSCSSLDINAIVCLTYTAAAATYLTLYRVLFESVVVCMFSDNNNNNRMQEHKMQCVSVNTQAHAIPMNLSSFG